MRRSSTTWPPDTTASPWRLEELIYEVLVMLNPLLFSAGQPLVRGEYRPRNLRHVVRP